MEEVTSEATSSFGGVYANVVDEEALVEEKELIPLEAKID